MKILRVTMENEGITLENSAEEWQYLLLVSGDRVELVPADQYRGMKNYELVSILHKRYGDKIAVISIDNAGLSSGGDDHACGLRLRC